MIRKIRPWGLGTFAGLVAAIALLWWLLAGFFVERAVERVGTRLLGARVDLDSAELGLFPISVTLHRLQLTNPDEPMTNALEVRRIGAAVAAAPLLRRKIVVDEMALEGVRFGTPRATSGALPGAPGAAERARAAAMRKAGELELPALEKPDAEAILASEELESVAIIEETRREVDEARESWKDRLDALPDEKRLKEVEQRIRKLKGVDGFDAALSAASELMRLQQEVQRDVNALEAAAKEVRKDVKRVKGLAQRAAEAPGRDVSRLREKYGLSSRGIANLSSRLLGPRVGALTARALGWWQRVEPVVARVRAASGEGRRGAAEPVESVRGRGIDVRFPERDPMPDFLIRRANVSVELAAGTIEGHIDDITPDQPVHGKPLRLAFAAAGLEGIGSLELRGVVDRIDPREPSDAVTFRCKGLALEDVALSESRDWAVKIERGALDLDARAKRSRGEIVANITAALKPVRLSTQFSDRGPVPSAIARTLAGIDSLQIDARVSGTPLDYRVDVHSDMDRLLANAAGKLINQQARRLEEQLRDGVLAKTAGPLKALRGDVDGVGAIEREITERVDLGDKLLSAESGSFGREKKLRLPGGFKSPL